MRKSHKRLRRAMRESNARIRQELRNELRKMRIAVLWAVVGFCGLVLALVLYHSPTIRLLLVG